jgi:hypothetical protein
MTRFALLLLLLSVAPACLAQTAVHHCVSSNGTPVFTDQPCDSAQSLRVGAIPPHSPRHPSCPTTPKALRERVSEAFTRRDPNALAGLMLWDGYRDVDAVREVTRLKRLMRRPLLDVAVTGEDAPASSATGIPPPAASSHAYAPVAQAELLVRLGGVQVESDGPLHFALERRAGCLWLRP